MYFVSLVNYVEEKSGDSSLKTSSGGNGGNRGPWPGYGFIVQRG